MGWGYRKVVVIGATSGIGRALAVRFMENGSSVVAVGRRKDKLDELVNEHGDEKVQTVVFDAVNLDAIPKFVADLTTSHPDIDCVFLNAGIQRKADFSKPESVDMDAIKEELTTNYLSPVALTKAFLPFLQSKEHDTCLIYNTSGLALVPVTRVPNYCASKAAMHHFILCLRHQLRRTQVKVVEVLPPAVQTELHDEKHQPDMKGGTFGMALAEFTDQTFQELEKGSDQIPIGQSKLSFAAFEVKRQEIFAAFAKAMDSVK